jgi:hypothetical protein
MTERQILYAQLGSNVVALAMLFVAWRWQQVARALYAALFLYASRVNARLAFRRPEVYLDYARSAVEPYRSFILGWFARHITAMVAAIALGQLTIGVLFILRGRAVTVAVVGAVLFLLAIVPLGQYSGFPATLIMAAGALLLLRARHARTLPGELAHAIRSRAVRAKLDRA